MNARHHTGRARLVLPLALLATLAGCERRTTLVPPPGGDSLSTSADSGQALLHGVQRAWEGREDLEQAAALTARLLLAEFRRTDPAGWEDRAEALCDSLGVGVETGGRPCALAVNVFLRSDPAAGSWPSLYWCAGREVRMHALEGKSLRLLGAEARSDSGATDATGFVALYARSRGTRQEPLVMVWARPKSVGDWRLTQTLGPDSLGGTGGGELHSGPDGVEVVARTYRTPPHFEECPTCPHVFWTHRFRWGPLGLERVEDAMVPSTYATFVHFVEALTLGGVDPANFVTDPRLVEDAIRLEWNVAKGVWRIAPRTEEVGSELTFFRGAQEAYRVRFVPRDDDFAIAGLEIVPKTVE